MKKLFIIILACISLLIFLPGCPQCTDNDCIDVEIAKVSIADSTANWLPYSGYDTLRFVNGNGFHATFIGSGYQNSSFPVHYSDYDYLCGDPMEACWEYYTFSERSICFTSEEVNLSFYLSIGKNIDPSALYKAALNPDTISDILILTFNYNKWAIPLQKPNKTGQTNIVEFYPTLMVAGTPYFNVYHVYFDNYIQGTIVKGGLFTKNEGLINFYLTNGEQWNIE